MNPFKEFLKMGGFENKIEIKKSQY